jgi:hypothetical protein
MQHGCNTMTTLSTPRHMRARAVNRIAMQFVCAKRLCRSAPVLRPFFLLLTFFVEREWSHGDPKFKYTAANLGLLVRLHIKWAAEPLAVIQVTHHVQLLELRVFWLSFVTSTCVTLLSKTAFSPLAKSIRITFCCTCLVGYERWLRHVHHIVLCSLFALRTCYCAYVYTTHTHRTWLLKCCHCYCR